MKKHLIAAAVASAFAAPAMAQNITITGGLETGFITRDVRNGTVNDNSSTVKQSAIVGRQVITPNITFMGTEDLGGGLKASFMLQDEFETDTGNEDVTGSTNSFSQAVISLSGGFGTVSVGKMNHATRDLGGIYRFMGDIGRLVSAMNSTNNVTNTLQYVSPTMNGWSFSVGRGDAGKVVTNEGAGIATTGADPANLTTFGVRGVIAGVNLAAAVETLKYSTTGGTQPENKLISVGGNYSFGKVRVGGIYADQKLTLGTGADGGKRRAMGLHGLIPIDGALELGASFTNYELTPAGGGAKPDTDVLTVGLKYSMSKRTAIYASYQSVSASNKGEALRGVIASGTSINGSTSAGTTRGMGVAEKVGGTSTGMGITVVHTF